jgi:transcriptional regulator with PAS, ATPase and Fis domain
MRALGERLLCIVSAGVRRLPPILIEGETGTGKSFLAATMHQASTRASEPFVSVNCAAIPRELLEAEFFGYESGAFTGARGAKLGLFQAATRGTLFLDEIGFLGKSLQAKLLTVLEERSVRRLGATRSEPVDLWIMAATNSDLRRATREGDFL